MIKYKYDNLLVELEELEKNSEEISNELSELHSLRQDIEFNYQCSLEIIKQFMRKLIDRITYLQVASELNNKQYYALREKILQMGEDYE